jgi:hypothetical protein
MEIASIMKLAATIQEIRRLEPDRWNHIAAPEEIQRAGQDPLFISATRRCRDTKWKEIYYETLLEKTGLLRVGVMDFDHSSRVGLKPHIRS